MKKIIAFAIGILIMLSVSAWPQGIKKSILAGTWYPADPEQLSRHIDYFLQNVKVDSLPKGLVSAIIVPHAGHVYSGQVAAYAYKLVQGKGFDTVVILSPSHRYGFEGCSIYLKGGYETPLGTAEVDELLAEEISKATGFAYIAKAHQEEHAVEIQVPFVQKVLPHAKIVPVVMGYPRKNTIMSLTNGLKKVLAGKKTLIIASTDLSHQLSKKDANARDQDTIAMIKDFKISTLIKKCERGENIMCGGGPVITTLLYAQHKATVEILKYADSSQVNRDEESVVGYLAAALVANSPQEEFHLTKEEREELLQLARSTIELFVRENKIPEYKTENTKLIEKMGIEKNFDRSSTGKAFREAGLDLSSFVGGISKAFVIVLSIILAIQILNIGGTLGQYLIDVANYLPRLLGGILIIVMGTVLVDFLASMVGRTLRPIFPEAKAEIAEMLRNLLLIGLVSVVLLIALDLMLLAGELVYPLILGFVIIGAGIALTDGLIESITDDHEEFKSVAGYAKFVLYSVFLIIGAGAIFATFEGVTGVVANISWAFAIALAIMLIPVMYAMAKKMSEEVP